MMDKQKNIRLVKLRNPQSNPNNINISNVNDVFWKTIGLEVKNQAK